MTHLEGAIRPTQFCDPSKNLSIAFPHETVRISFLSHSGYLCCSSARCFLGNTHDSHSRLADSGRLAGFILKRQNAPPGARARAFMSVGSALCLGHDPSPATLPSYAVSHSGDRAKLLQRIVVEASLFPPKCTLFLGNQL